MSMRAKLISSVVLAAIALATWRFVAPPTGVPRVEARKPAPDPEAAPAPQVETPEPAAALAPFPPAQEAPAPTQNPEHVYRVFDGPVPVISPSQ